MRRSNKAAVRTEPAEVAEAAAAEVEAQEEAEEEVVITINISAVLTYKVMTAKSKADVVFTSMWLVCGIFFAAVGIIALLAIGVASQWPHCFAQDCRAGMVCVSVPEGRLRGSLAPDYRNGTDGFKRPTCEDCYLTARTGGTLSAPDDSLWFGNVAVGSSTRTTRPRPSSA